MTLRLELQCLALVLLLTTFAQAEAPLDCAATVADFATQLGSMLEAGEPIGLDALRAQLGPRGRCTIPSVPRRTEVLASDALYNLCRQSVVMVGKVYKCDKCTNWHVVVASGCVIGGDTIATNYHVVGRDDEHTRGIGIRTWDGRLLTIKSVLTSDKAHDLAVLRVNANDLTPLPIAEHAPTGATVYCISHPVSHLYTMTHGIISGYFQRRHHVDMAITADFAKGSSGGAILDSAGNLVGMVRATNPVYYEKKDGVDTNVQMVWKYCVPSADLLELVR